jgi:hypothetical protein
MSPSLITSNDFNVDEHDDASDEEQGIENNGEIGLRSNGSMNSEDSDRRKSKIHKFMQRIQHSPVALRLKSFPSDGRKNRF